MWELALDSKSFDIKDQIPVTGITLGFFYGNGFLFADLYTAFTS